MTTGPSRREIDKRLDEHALRLTPGRRAVLDALRRCRGPRSAAELHTVLGDRVPLSSLYRTLAVLEEADVVVPHFGARGITRYELAEWITGHHHHLVCLDCGAVEDVVVPRPVEAEVEQLVAGIAAIAEFDPTGHVLEIEGRCARCA